MQLEGKEMIAVLFRGLERGQGAESVQDKASKQAPRRWGGGSFKEWVNRFAHLPNSLLLLPGAETPGIW